MAVLGDIVEQALAVHQMGQLKDAQRLYLSVLVEQPNNFDALHLLGVLKYQCGELAESLRLIEAALAQEPNAPRALSNRALVLGTLGRTTEALASYERAMELAPDFVEPAYNRGNLLAQLERFAEAVESFDKAIAIKPDYIEAHNNRGNVLRSMNRSEEALASYHRALSLRSDYADSLNNIGTLLRELDRPEEGLAYLDRAIASAPNHADGHFNRGLTMQALSRNQEAVESHDRAVACRPDLLGARIAACMSELRPMYRDETELRAQRAAYERRLRSLHHDFSDGRALGDFAAHAGTTQPFYLGYQGQDDRALQSLYGSLMCRALAAHYAPVLLSDPPAPGEPVRVGIVSGYFCRHSVWKIPIKGWLSQLDRQRFRVNGYHTSTADDGFTKEAAGYCDRFVAGALPISQWRREIAADRPHVLIYPEVGMDPTTVQLAAQRLAPLQCISLGHPVTTGFSTLDVFLTSDLMEAPEGDRSYTERLVRLPNLSIYYEPLDIPLQPASRADLGLHSDVTVFWCGQSLYKYLPQFDHVFARIAKAAGACQFAFIRFERADHITEMFRERLARAFGAVGLRADDYCVFLPRMSWSEFGAACGAADIFLDSIGWSGFNSAMESLPYALPIVTFPQSLMRSRHSLGVLRMLGISETIASSVDEYVAIATRLVKDMNWRASIKAKIEANRHHVYRDTACIAALEEFLDRSARAVRSA